MGLKYEDKPNEYLTLIGRDPRTCFELVLDKMAEITYFLVTTWFFSIPLFL
jgi:hypothetical protein